MQVHSIAYLRWWFVDRLVSLWEQLVGRFFLDTKIMWLFYKCLGAKVSFSSQIKAFIRDFDIVSVGPRSLVEHPIRCHRFKPWMDDNDLSMVTRPIGVGSDCKVAGTTSPGVRVGNGSTIEKISAVEDGCIVPEGVVASGTSAYPTGAAESTGRGGVDAFFELTKIVWMHVELYLYFSFFLLFDLALGLNLPTNWRYARLMYWVLLLLFVSAVSMLFSIALKWILIGLNTPERRKSRYTWRVKSADWICDFHFKSAATLPFALFGFSKIWTVIMRAHGMSIDFASSFNNFLDVTPSVVDLIVVQRSFVSVVSFDWETCNDPIEIIDSSVGYQARICSGAKVVRSLVPPRVVVRESQYDANRTKDTKIALTPFKIFATELTILATAIATVASMIPAFEVFTQIVLGSPTSIGLLGVMCAIITQALVWNFLAWIISFSAWAPDGIRSIVYAPCMQYLYSNRVWSFTQLLSGTFLQKHWLRFMGAQVNGDVWAIDATFHDIPLLRFGDRCVIDFGCSLNAHFAVEGDLVIAPSTVGAGALLNPGCYLNAGGYVPDNQEHGALRCFLGDRSCRCEKNTPSALSECITAAEPSSEDYEV